MITIHDTSRTTENFSMLMLMVFTATLMMPITQDIAIMKWIENRFLVNISETKRYDRGSFDKNVHLDMIHQEHPGTQGEGVSTSSGLPCYQNKSSVFAFPTLYQFTCLNRLTTTSVLKG